MAGVVRNQLNLPSLRKVSLVLCYGARENEVGTWVAPALLTSHLPSQFSRFVEALCAELGGRGYNGVKAAGWLGFVDIHNRGDHFLASRKDASQHGKKILNYPLGAGIPGTRKGHTRAVVTPQYRDAWKKYYMWSRETGLQEQTYSQWHDSVWEEAAPAPAPSWSSYSLTAPTQPAAPTRAVCQHNYLSGCPYCCFTW